MALGDMKIANFSITLNSFYFILYLTNVNVLKPLNDIEREYILLKPCRDRNQPTENVFFLLQEHDFSNLTPLMDKYARGGTPRYSPMNRGSPVNRFQSPGSSNRSYSNSPMHRGSPAQNSNEVCHLLIFISLHNGFQGM